jgi:hypothetical protein
MNKKSVGKDKKNRHWHTIHATALITRWQASSELQGQCYKSPDISPNIYEKYLQQNDRAQGSRLAITGRCVGQESPR